MERRKIKKVHEEKMSENNHIYPDIILAAERIYGSICAPVFNDEDEYEVLLLVNSDVYNDTAMSTNAREFLNNRNGIIRSSHNLHWLFRTLQDCSDYSRYNIIKTGLKMKFKDISDSEQVQNYIEKFRKGNLEKK